MQSTFIFQVRVRSKAGRNQFEAYFCHKPEAAELIDAIKIEQKRLREGAEDSEDFIDTEVNEERAQELDTLIEIVQYAKKIEAGQQVRVAGTEIGSIDMQGIPAYARDPNLHRS